MFRQKENHRQGAARNVGLDKSSGDFACFVDSDDEVGEGLLRAVKMAVDRCLDMVAMRISKLQDGRVEDEKDLPYHEDRVFSGVELQTEHPFWFTGPVAYVYRKSFLKEVNYRFTEDVLFEDSDFVNVHLYYAKRMSYCDECGYVVHYNSESTTHALSYRHLCDYALLGTRMLNFYESLDDKTTKYAKGILEGGSYNIKEAFRKLLQLKSRSEVRAFYDRFDSYYDRKRLLGYRRPEYCWNRWTRLGLRHRNRVVFLSSFAAPVIKLYQK